MFFTEVTGNRVSDHYARNIYIKVSLKIAVLWILLTLKILYWNISKFVRKYRSRRPEVITVLAVVTIKHAFPMLILFQPFFLIIKGDFVTFRKIHLCVKSHGFIFFLIPCCPFSFKTELRYLHLSLRPILQIR